MILERHRCLQLLTMGLLLPLSAGCLEAPATQQERMTGVDHVGPNDSEKPLRVGQASREMVIAQLGPPTKLSRGRSCIGYEFDAVVGHKGYVTIGGPCGMCGEYPWKMLAKETLWLAFDQAGVLKSYNSSRDKPVVAWDQFVASTGN